MARRSRTAHVSEGEKWPWWAEKGSQSEGRDAVAAAILEVWGLVDDDEGMKEYIQPTDQQPCSSECPFRKRGFNFLRSMVPADVSWPEYCKIMET